ncbi:hypothetical protein HDK77DRAFT_268055 [Phyllosticta capitalensis]
MPALTLCPSPASLPSCSLPFLSHVAPTPDSSHRCLLLPCPLHPSVVRIPAAGGYHHHQMLSPALPCPALPCPACTALPLLTPILVIAGAYRYKAAALTCSAVSECLVSSHKAASCLTTHVASANCRNNDELPPLWLGSWIGQGEHGTVGLPASPTGPPQQPTRNTACVRVRGVRGRAREGGPKGSVPKRRSRNVLVVRRPARQR